MPDQHDQRDRPLDSGLPRHAHDAERDETGGGRDWQEHTLDFSFGSTKPIPAEQLPPDLVARLRSGQPPSAKDMALLRSAAGGEAAMASMLMGAMAAAGVVRREDIEPGEMHPDDVPIPAEMAGDPDVMVVPMGGQKFTWKWNGESGSPREAGAQPATYYEAMTGRPDPMRGFIVTVRRTLDIITWVIAIGLPVGLVVAAIATGQSSETIFFAGFFGVLVGLMLKKSAPRTPFG